jgi:hypothetical protein
MMSDQNSIDLFPRIAPGPRRCKRNALLYFLAFFL